MRVYFKPSFIRDFKKLPSDIKRGIRFICTGVFPKLNKLQSFQSHPIKPISGFKDYYRIKINDFRIGFKKTGNTIEFMRAKHRKDIYRHFP